MPHYPSVHPATSATAGGTHRNIREILGRGGQSVKAENFYQHACALGAGDVRDAVRAFIDASITGPANAALRQRYENALKVQRGGTEGDNIAVLPKSK